MRDLQQLSELVVLAIKAATAPLLERLAAAEQTTRDLQARLLEQASWRDRIVALEVKSGLPVPPGEALTDMSDRLMRLEFQVAQVPPAADLEPVRQRLAVVESAAPTWDSVARELSAVRERLAVAEVHSTAPPPAAPQEHGDDLRWQTLGVTLQRVESAASGWEAPAAKLDAQLVTLTKEVGALRERVAVVEVRPLAPGPPGAPGKDGRDGSDGRDGVDGLGFDDLGVRLDGKTLTMEYSRGAAVKSFPLTLPIPVWVGVYQEHTTYTKGDLVTWAGSTWHCNEETSTKPGDGSKAWTLMVKRGRDGRDGDAPIVAVRR
jgi:hypothetical protein